MQCIPVAAQQWLWEFVGSFLEFTTAVAAYQIFGTKLIKLFPLSSHIFILS